MNCGETYALTKKQLKKLGLADVTYAWIEMPTGAVLNDNFNDPGARIVTIRGQSNTVLKKITVPEAMAL